MIDIVITNNSGEKLDYAFAAGASDKRQKDILVILGHGVTGNKDRPILVETAKALNEAGFDTLRFSFAGNGDSEGTFGEATVSKEDSDLDSVLSAVSESYAKITYIGHSMGCAVGVTRAAVDSRIQFLISLAGMVDTRTFAQTEFGELTPDKDVMWEEPSCPLSSAFMDDLCEQVGTVALLASKITIPWLLVHGMADDVVLPGDSTGLKDRMGEQVDLVTVDGADHVFSDAEHMKQATAAVVAWLEEQV